MKYGFAIGVFVIACLATTRLFAAPADEEGFVAMFNGTDLTGWDSKPGGWWVEDGAITSESAAEPCGQLFR